MNHGPRGIQQERRLFEIGEETAGSTGQRGKSKGKTPEQKERDRLRKIEYRKENRGMIRAYNVAKHAARRPDIEKRKAAKAEKSRQRELWIQYQRACMEEIRQHRSKAVYPCWSVLMNVTADACYHREKALARYHALTPEQKRERNKKLQDGRNKEAQAEYLKKWRSQNPDKHREGMRRYMRERKVADPGFRIACNMRNRFKEIMDVVRDSSRKWESSLIGCNTKELAAHLESKFKRGMSWGNYGTSWHVDHVVPCSKFDHTIPAHVQQCWHYSNLQPLWAKENLAKSDKIMIDTQLSLTL